MRIPEIEKGVPLPKHENPMDAVLKKMNKGDSIRLSMDEAPQWRNRVSSHFPQQFKTLKIDNETVRIWRK